MSTSVIIGIAAAASVFLLLLVIACAFAGKPVLNELAEIQAEEEAKK